MPNHLNWFLSMWRTSGSQMTNFLCLSLRLSPDTLWRKCSFPLLVFAVSLFQSLTKVHYQVRVGTPRDQFTLGWVLEGPPTVGGQSHNDLPDETVSAYFVSLLVVNTSLF